MQLLVQLLGILSGVFYALYQKQIQDFFKKYLSLGWTKLTTFFPVIINKFLWTLVGIYKATLILYYAFSKTIELLTKSLVGTIISGISLVFTYFTIWHIFGLIHDPSQSIIGFLYEKVGFNDPDDSVTILLLNIVIKTLPFTLTATLTLFYFIYREQRSASISTTLTSGKTLLLYIVFTLITMLLGVHLDSSINRDIIQFQAMNPNVKGTLEFSSINIGRLLVWFVLTIVSIVLAIKTVIVTIRNLNIRNMISDVLGHISDQFFLLRVTGLRMFRKDIYKDLLSSVESLHQLLQITIEKNMNEAYDKAYEQWISIIAEILQSPRLMKLDNTVICEYLLAKDEGNFKKLYEVILKFHVIQIMTLIKNHKIETAHGCIEVFFQLNPSEDELRLIYLNALQELSLLMYSNDTIGLKTIFDGLEMLVVEDKGKDLNEINLIYKGLINKAIEKNDVKMLSSISYSMFKSLKLYKETAIKSKPKLKYLQLREKINLGSDKTTKFNKCIVFILLQAGLKSVELSHYACTGFILKFIVTSFESVLLRDTFYVFTKNKGQNNPYLIDREQYAKLNVDFNFNKMTIDYCHKKLSILLLAQQRYVQLKNINFGEIPNEVILVGHVSCNYLDYLFDKIQSAKSKYGLLFLEEKKSDSEAESFMDRIKNEIIAKAD